MELMFNSVVEVAAAAYSDPGPDTIEWVLSKQVASAIIRAVQLSNVRLLV
jgi:hypothetical protein